MTEFRKPNDGDILEIEAFKRECIAANSSMDGTSTLCNVSAAEWIAYNREMEHCTEPGYVSALQYGLFESGSGRLLGLLQIRLELKGYLVDFGGHIGYCVRPAERRKGYAKQMLMQALPICREQGIPRVLVTCLESNLASAKTIEACGGEFEKTVFDDRNYLANMKRYWIRTDKTFCTDLTVSHMMQTQRDLFELHKDEWTPREPQFGRDRILYMIEEIGETVAILKKKGEKAIMEDPAVRQAFLGEMSDVMMYYIATLLCFRVSPEEISQAFERIHAKNMHRDYASEYKELYHG